MVNNVYFPESIRKKGDFPKKNKKLGNSSATLGGAKTFGRYPQLRWEKRWLPSFVKHSSKS